jgi:hypothetical protein
MENHVCLMISFETDTILKVGEFFPADAKKWNLVYK